MKEKKPLSNTMVLILCSVVFICIAAAIFIFRDTKTQSRSSSSTAHSDAKYALAAYKEAIEDDRNELVFIVLNGGKLHLFGYLPEWDNIQQSKLQPVSVSASTTNTLLQDEQFKKQTDSLLQELLAEGNVFETADTSSANITERVQDIPTNVQIYSGYCLTEYIETLAINRSEVNLKVGTHFALLASSPDAVFRSENTSIAIVESNGVITGVSNGTTTVIVTSGGNQVKCTVTVGQ